MKKCPFCAEEIQDAAIKCRFCGEFMDGFGRGEPKKKWYYSTAAVVIGLLVAGPFALPLVWRNPRYSLAVKVVITIVVFVLTIFFCYFAYKYTIDRFNQLIKQINDLGISFSGGSYFPEAC